MILLLGDGQEFPDPASTPGWALGRITAYASTAVRKQWAFSRDRKFYLIQGLFCSCPLDADQPDALSGVAGALVHAGVSAAIGTLPEISDDSVLLFTRDFYRRLCEGQALETALAEAGKALSVERRDWSVYALFASTRQLEGLAIPPPIASSAGASLRQNN